MCDLEIDGYGVTLRDSSYKAKTNHVCDECGRRIKSGDFYSVYVGKYEGSFFSSKFCQRCTKARKWLESRGHGWTIGRIRRDVRYCVETDKEIILSEAKSRRTNLK